MYSSPAYHQRHSWRPLFRLLLLLVSITAGLLLIWLLGVLLTNQQVGSTAHVLAAQNSLAATTTQDTQTGAVAQTEQSSVNAGSPSTPSCTSGLYKQPQTMAADQLSNGLTTVIAKPVLYTVHGNTIAEIRQNIRRCNARQQVTGRYHATTAYSLSWSYATIANNGACSASRVKVAIAISQYLPAPGLDATASTAAQTIWANYHRNLVAHENGHVERDLRYANELLLALQSLQAPCSIFAAQATIITDSYVHLLNSNNQLYDIQTDHGAAQGAIL